MKICLINNLHKPFSRGGADRVLEIARDGFCKRGFDVFVISTKPYFLKYDDDKNYYLKSFFHYLNKIPKLIRLFYHFADFLSIKKYLQIKKILKKEKPDLIITHNFKGLGLLVLKAIKNSKIKHVHVLHDIQLIHPSGLMIVGKEDMLESFFTKIYYSAVNKIINSPNLIISPSKWLMCEHEKRGFFQNSKKIIIQNPVSIKNNFSLKNKKDSAINFLYVGELEDHKGIMFLLNAFNKFSKNKNIKLSIIGKGSEYDKIQGLKNEKVEVLGWKTGEQVKAAMQNADCLIVPSLCYENSPTVIYEAASLGLPVLASRIGGITEIIHYLGGTLFEAGNEKDLFKKINYILKNLDSLKKIGTNSKYKINKFSVENYFEKLKSEIDQSNILFT
ncbi:glycosyltransferase [Candidatus Parcubacteria bacterium]|nr:glycosyltransferase [Candidatus Parcubacteria bacterium]